jgi:hypothetical protein
MFVSLVYFALVDWLYTARLAGYMCIIEMPEALTAPAPIAAVPPYVLPPTEPPSGEPAPMAPARTTIDRDEPITSDVPNLAVET